MEDYNNHSNSQNNYNNSSTNSNNHENLIIPSTSAHTDFNPMSPPRRKSRSTSMSSDLGFGFHSPMQWLSSPFGTLEPLSPSASSFSFVLNSPNQFLAALDAHNRDSNRNGLQNILSPSILSSSRNNNNNDNNNNNNNINNNNNNIISNSFSNIHNTASNSNNNRAFTKQTSGSALNQPHSNLNAIFSKINVEKNNHHNHNQNHQEHHNHHQEQQYINPSFSSPINSSNNNIHNSNSSSSCSSSSSNNNSSNSSSETRIASSSNQDTLLINSSSSNTNTSLVSDNSNEAFAEGAQFHCNCKKSKCLKLYCECFTALKFCEGCNCVDCNNTEAHVKIRDAAIRSTKDRNSVAFQNKVTDSIGHQTGCNCKQSRCLKKYCECFHASALCGNNCKCQSCSNFEGSFALQSARMSVDKSSIFSATKEKRKSPSSIVDISPNTSINLNKMVLDTSTGTPDCDVLNSSIQKASIANKVPAQKKKRKVMAPVLYTFFGPSIPPLEKILALRILEFLSNADLYSISQVNSTWNKAAMDDALWE